MTLERRADVADGQKDLRVLVARCENYREDVDAPCTGEIRFRWGMSQSDPCDVCGARCGIAVAEWVRVELPGSPDTGQDRPVSPSMADSLLRNWLRGVRSTPPPRGAIAALLAEYRRRGDLINRLTAVDSGSWWEEGPAKGIILDEAIAFARKRAATDHGRAGTGASGILAVLVAEIDRLTAQEEAGREMPEL